MSDNVKIRTEDVIEILDTRILASADHTRLAVITGESYASVLDKIAARSPTLDEKAGLEAAVDPSGSNYFVTLSQMNTNLAGKIPWKTIGPLASGADYEGSDGQPFVDAFASGLSWFMALEGTWTLGSALQVPAGVTLLGASPEATTIQGQLLLEDFVTLQNLKVDGSALGPLDPAVLVEGPNVTLTNTSIVADTAGFTLEALSQDTLRLFESQFTGGTATLQSCTNVFVTSCFFSCTGATSIEFDHCVEVVVSGCEVEGVLTLGSCTHLRALGNHLQDAVSTPKTSKTLWGTEVLFRGNTPADLNTEDEDFAAVLQYIGSPDLSDPDPAYSSNFAGPPGQNLTARASALDLLVQWAYEERNFILTPEDPLFGEITWDPTLSHLTSNGPLALRSLAHDSYWLLPALDVVLAPGEALYYTLDRSLTTSPITLSPLVAPLGSVPCTSGAQQSIVLAYRDSGEASLWWWKAGVRFTSAAEGVYFVDGRSKSFLEFMGAPDYATSDPNYPSNFGGPQGESLTLRGAKLDALLQTLYEYSNIGVVFPDDTHLEGAIGGDLVLQGTLAFSFPHTPYQVTLAPQTWTLPTNSILYLTWDQSLLLVGDVVPTATVTSLGGLPLPSPYTNTREKNFLFARRDVDSLYLWDGTEIPLTGGRWPVPKGRTVTRTGSAATLADNLVWDGSSLYWEGLAVAVSTGLAIDRNFFVDNLVGFALPDGYGLLVTHTWNDPGVAQSVNVDLVELPLSSHLPHQNQFLWCQNAGGHLIFFA